MTSPNELSKPTFIYKLIPTSSPLSLDVADLPERLPVSDIDQSSGFVHLSSSTQILNTLRWFFTHDKMVYVARIDYDKHDHQIRWEDPKAEVCGPRGGEGMFPHLYNGLKLGKDQIDSVHLLENKEGGWEVAISKANEEWLV